VQEIRIRGPKTTGEAHQTISLYQTAGKDLRKNFPQKENPGRYGLQSPRENDHHPIESRRDG
jgi:hypothetical protein